MAQLRRDYGEFVKRCTEVIAIGPEKPLAFADWWREHAMPFPGLADPEHTVSKLYGQEVRFFKLGRMPAQLIIDKNGMIRYSHYGDSMKDIAENSELLSTLDELNREEA